MRVLLLLPVFLMALLLAAAPARAHDFGTDSARLTNRWFTPTDVGDYLLFDGQGKYEPHILYESARRTKLVDGVACLEIQRMLMPRNNAESSHVFLTYCAAQDTEGNVLVLEENGKVFGARGARVVFPAHPREDMAFGRYEGNVKTVRSVDASITLAHSGKTFRDCVKIVETIKNDELVRYHAPEVGTVLMGEGEDRFELSYFQRTP